MPFPKINVSKHTAKNIIKGAPIYENGIIEFEIFEKDEFVSIFMENEFIGVGRALKSSRDMDGKTIILERVHKKSV